MSDQAAPAEAPDTTRRRFLVRLIQGVHATIGATLAFVFGGAILSPSLARRERSWLGAANLATLKDGEPLAVTLRVARQDGATEAVDRRVVYLVRAGDNVRALDSTCTTSAVGRGSTPRRGRSSALPWRRLRRRGPRRVGAAAASARRAARPHRQRPRDGAGVAVLGRLLDWLHDRTGYRTGLSHLLDERLPPGTGWAFTTGSVITLLLGVQLLSGVVLAMYYVPSPALAYDSVRFVMRDLPMGAMVRGLHVWGASFLVVAAAVHMLRVFGYGAYKAPREVTWLTGLVALLVILAFSLSGYLLPWDQKAYWATTVTINVAKGTPLIGDRLADVLRGGPELGALTLGRWYVAHVFLLPAALIGFVVAHLFLMRRHGISGPMRPSRGAPIPFFPWHVMKDTVVMAAVFASLFAMAAFVPAPLDEVANPADAEYIPRPEWYFLSLFQLLKYFPGPLEPVATQVIPGAAVGFLALLPFLDRHPERRPWARARLPYSIGMGVLALSVTGLTVLGLKDSPGGKAADDWGLLPIAGFELATGENNTCARCHVAGGPAAPLATRPAADRRADQPHDGPGGHRAGRAHCRGPRSRSAMGRFGAQAVVAHCAATMPGSPPELAPAVRLAAMTYASTCVVCHRISGEGGTVGPDLTTIGRRRSEEQIRAIIEDPALVYGESRMPAFKSRLTGAQVEALAAYLATRK